MKGDKNQFFSLVELMLVIAILAILASLLTPALKKMTNSAKFLDCKTNLKGIYTAMISYTEDHDDYLPGPVRGNVVATFQDKGRDRYGFYAYRNQTPSVYLSDYLENSPYYYGLTLLPILQCPAVMDEAPQGKDREVVYFNGSRYTISHYLNLNKSLFGKKKGNNIKPKIENYPQKLSSIQNISLEKVFSDRQNWGSKSGLSIHEGGLENVLYLDGVVVSEVSLPE